MGRVNFGAKNLAVILNEVKNPLEESADDENGRMRSEEKTNTAEFEKTPLCVKFQ